MQQQKIVNEIQVLKFGCVVPYWQFLMHFCAHLQAEDQQKLVEQQRQLLEERQKFEEDRRRKQLEEQKMILGKQGARPKLSFSFK